MLERASMGSYDLWNGCDHAIAWALQLALQHCVGCDLVATALKSCLNSHMLPTFTGPQCPFVEMSSL